MISQKRWRVVVSIPAVGSSKKRISGLPIRQRTKARRRFCPPESLFANCWYWSSLNCKSAWISTLDNPFSEISWKKAISSLTFNCEGMVFSWRRTAIWSCAFPFLPLIKTWPLLAFLSPRMQDIKVVLPAPFGPIKARQSPCPTSKLIWSKIVFPLIFLTRFVTWRTASLMCVISFLLVEG